MNFDQMLDASAKKLKSWPRLGAFSKLTPDWIEEAGWLFAVSNGEYVLESDRCWSISESTWRKHRDWLAGGGLPICDVGHSDGSTASEAVIDQPKPNGTGTPVVAMVMHDMIERMEKGIETYGQALRADNGRCPLIDAYQEALDLAIYLKQAIIEKSGKES